MGDWWKDFIPSEAIAPVIGGVLVWFGANFAFLGPNVIAPRAAEKHYFPLCMAAVEQSRVQLAEDVKLQDQQFEERLMSAARQTQKRIDDTKNTAAKMFWGGYGQSGEAFMRKYGIGEYSSGGTISYQVAQEMEDLRNQYAAEKRAAREKARANIKITDPASFCACNMDVGLSERLEVSAFTASLRLYKPQSIKDLENGRFFSECGLPPAV